MNRFLRNLLISAGLLLTLVSLGCAAGNYSGDVPTQHNYDYHGDVASPYPPYFRPSH